MRTVSEILADPQTPMWIRAALKRLRRNYPQFTALREAIHDLRAKRS